MPPSTTRLHFFAPRRPLTLRDHAFSSISAIRLPPILTQIASASTCHVTRILTCPSISQSADQVVANCGWEQEFFVVDREMYLKRPDLLYTGRTVLGALPARHQQTDMNYFAPVQPRVKAYLEEFSAESQKVC